MRNHLICVGFGKCGTTLLNYLLKRSPRFIVPREKKEILYFRNSAPDYNEYLQNFAVPKNCHTAQPVYFEASPPYVTGMDGKYIAEIFHRIDRTLPLSKIIICLRHPAYRAYSHYIHNLQAFALWGSNQQAKPPNHPKPLLKTPCSDSFEKALVSMNNVRYGYEETIRLALKQFGRSRVKFFFLERDATAFEDFFPDLCEFLNLECDNIWRGRSVPKVFSTEVMPTYIYAGHKNVRRIKTARGPLDLSPGQILAVSRRESFILNNPGEAAARSLLDCSSSWTAKVSATDFQTVFENYFRCDIEQMLELLTEFPTDRNFLESYLSFPYVAKEMKVIDLNDENLHPPYYVP